MYYSRFSTNFCEIILAGDEAGLGFLHLFTGEGKAHLEISPDWIQEDDFFLDIKTQILEYMDGRRKNFNVKLNPKGSDFQKKVWLQLREIPYGETRSYKDIAIALNNPKATRAVGMANSKNPIPLIVPCHRVIGADGSLTGFAGGLTIKKQLLDLEASNR